MVLLERRDRKRRRPAPADRISRPGGRRPAWTGSSIGDLAFALDFHCPYSWGGDINDRPFFLREPAAATDRLTALATTLGATTREESSPADRTLTFDSTPGVGLATFDNQSGCCHTFTRYCSQFGADPSVALEIPYVGTDTDPVTPTTARRFGRDLADAIATWAADQ